MALITEITKSYFDRFMPRPRDGFSSANMRNQYIALASGDFLPFRAMCQLVVESHDYGSDIAASGVYSGTGVTVTTNKASQYEGLACLECTIDGTGNRTAARAALGTVIDISDFTMLGIWARCDTTSSAIQFYLKDGSANESYWDITTNGTADTWEQAALTLASPDSNNGTPAVLTDIESYGYKGLDASVVYLFDEILAHIWAMKVYMTQSYIGDYFYPFYDGTTRISYAGGLTGTITAPSVNPRLDLISYNPGAGTITVTSGSEVAAPVFSDIPAVPADEIPLYAVYVPTTATKIVEYHDKSNYPTDGYIYADLRPLYEMSATEPGANKALSNLSSVAINTSLLPAAADTHSLGSVDKEWLSLYIGDAGKIYLGLGQDVSIERSAANEMTITATSGVTLADCGVLDADGIDLVTGNDYQINNVSVLNATTLGATVLASSLTSLGTIASLVATTADINAGTFDGIVGGTTPADGSFSTLSATGDVTLTTHLVGGDGTTNPTNLLTNGNFELWSAGTSSAPDGWTLTNGSVAREGTIIKTGTYSAALTRAGANATIRQRIDEEKGIDYYKGRLVTYSCWVYATVADRARLNIEDAGTADNYSSYHTGNSSWQLLTVTTTIGSGSSMITCYCNVSTGDTTAYFDGAMLVEGAMPYAFSPRPVQPQDTPDLNGIKFPATQSASADANTLDDYEEGTWTPVLSLATAGDSAQSSQYGSYVKIGNRVFITGNVTIVKGTGTGTLTLTGLPFTNKNVADNWAALTINWYGGGNANEIPIALVDVNSNVVSLQMQSLASGGTYSAMDNTDLAAAFATARISGHYLV